MEYSIYPSLLDAYLRFKRHDDEETFQSLFDKINRVETEKTEAQLRGVEFEQLINKVIDGNECSFLNDHYLTDNFRFNIELVKAIANKLSGAIQRQEYMEAIMKTHAGKIRLYGIADFSFPEMLADLKGTSNYKYCKYKDNTQHPTYSLIKKLNGSPIKAFKYVASDFDKMFIETYIPSENMHDKLMITVFEFIRFIEHFRKHITNDKIFSI
jgi:hypothetical protein